MNTVEEISQRASYSWDGQRSDNPKIQAIIDHGFWVDKITGNLIHCSLYGLSEIDYSGDLPRISMVRHESNRTYIAFNIGEGDDLIKEVMS